MIVLPIAVGVHRPLLMDAGQVVKTQQLEVIAII